MLKKDDENDSGKQDLEVTLNAGPSQLHHYVQALVKLHCTLNVPLLSDPWYNAYFQLRPSLYDRLVALGYHKETDLGPKYSL